MDLPIKLAPLCPLFNTHVQLFLKTLASCKQLLGTKNIFLLPSGSPITCVEILGIVTEKVSREEFVKIALQDGTGRVQCLIYAEEQSSHLTVRESALELQSRILKEKKLNKHQKDFHRKLIDESFVPDVIVGDFLLVRGELRPLKWEEGTYVICKKFRKISDQRDCLDVWHSWTERARDLHENVYAKQFSLSSLSVEVRKSDKIKMIGESLTEKLKNYLDAEVFVKGAKIFQFHGYEALEFEGVSALFTQVFESKNGSDVELTKSEIVSIRNNALITALHHFVQSGAIFKQKVFYSRRITGVDQLDAIYHVTNNCSLLRHVVDKVLKKNEKLIDRKIEESIRSALLDTKLHFLVKSKHFNSVLNQITAKIDP